MNQQPLSLEDQIRNWVEDQIIPQVFGQMTEEHPEWLLQGEVQVASFEFGTRIRTESGVEVIASGEAECELDFSDGGSLKVHAVKLSSIEGKPC
ncbi:hypothetical protein [Pontibacter sp. G13]|uniref:hypothetical protein n=1 Tax=Pontibacter sp. G13 TaxID=3074898 RepID=UPI00288A74D3|nr:hypothetical protein [Pontibacter sp. G13]WNJ16909.1 hypothetical protein RJD25_18770 [Pontibacter sp. G13]